MMSASAYVAGIRNLLIDLTRDGLIEAQPRLLVAEIQPGNMRGRFVTPGVGLHYFDGATLRIEENFLITENGNVDCIRYAYHYERPGGYYFRFEREQHDDDQLYKPEHHLHVCWRLPHFPAPPMTLTETLDFIRINFYSSHRQRLVGQTLACQI
ncbi:MAG: DUF6516 family protein [Caldilineaceae bacterium]